MYKILSISRNIRLMLERNDTLALCGFRVVSPRTPEEAPLLARQQKVDAVIIGHSVEPESRAELIGAIRRLCPKCLIFFVFVAPDHGEEPLADVSLDVTRGTEPLIRAIQARLPRQVHAAAKS
jgi:DNA-binding NarL/FixJ family response regulator